MTSDEIGEKVHEMNLNRYEKNICNAIETIRTRPGMYLGSNSITALMHFLDGYRFAERVYDANWSNEMFPLNFEYMHEFVHVRMKRYWKAILTEKNIEWNDSMEHGASMRANVKTPWFKNPIAVYVIELTIKCILYGFAWNCFGYTTQRYHFGQTYLYNRGNSNIIKGIGWYATRTLI